jgi:ATP-dependent RNA helicase DeaD
MGSVFEELGLMPELVRAVEKMGFEQPTPIQQAAIPALLAGRNIIGQAQTGTGKTAAFGLPMLQTLIQALPQDGKPGGKRSIRALVLAPTRELAMQVASAIGHMTGDTGLRVMPVYGGQPYSVQIRQIERGVDVIVGTPGRMLDLINRKVLDLSHVLTLVLDEADEMLEMGFIEDVETILAQAPEERQIALFSATMPAAVRKLADRYVSSPEVIAINPTHMTVAETEQRYYRVREENKLEALVRLLEAEAVKSALIFARTKARAQELADTMMGRGYPAESLHGDLSQARREYVLNRFRRGTITILVATDVAARGLDIDDVSHVFNYDAPADAEDYVHRIGRTGRAGRKGVAITFFHPRDKVRRREIEAYTRQVMTECPVPGPEAVKARRDDRFIERLYQQMLADDNADAVELVARLLEANLDPAEIAVAAIRMARADETAINMADLSERAEPRPTKRAFEDNRPYKQAYKNGSAGKPAFDKRDNADRPERADRRQEAGMIRLVMNLGETHGLRPGDVVGAIASEVGIPGRAIGEIAIHRGHTFVDVSEKHVRQVLQASTGKYHLRGQPVVLTLAS